MRDEQLASQLTAAAPEVTELDWELVEQRLTSRHRRRRTILGGCLAVAAVALLAAVALRPSGSGSGGVAVDRPADQPDSSQDGDAADAPSTDSETESEPESEPDELSPAETDSTFVVPEGLWLDEMLASIADQVPSVTVAELEAALESGDIQPAHRPAGNQSWEGLLFPATYPVGQTSTAEDIVLTMSNQLTRVTDELGFDQAAAVHGLSPYEVIIVASMIEAEAKTDRDRAMIARVIYNRLAIGLPIAIDATLIYEAGVRGQIPTREQLDTPTPYNTRHPENVGLPPTPIAAPGRASLEAAMNPADGPWLFYVVIDNDGNHAFASNLDEHNENVARARENGVLD